MKEAFIIDAIRSPIGKYRTSLKKIRADDLAALAIKKIVERNNLADTSEIDDVFIGCANQAGEDNRNVARMSLLLAGLPISVPGETINRLCGSGMSAVIHAQRAIQTNNGDLFIAGGVEQMTRAPFVQGKSSETFEAEGQIYDTSLSWRFPNPELKTLYGTDPMGETAEIVADRFKVSRKEQDRFAYLSQMKAAKAEESGRLSKERFEIENHLSTDEFIRPTTTEEVLATLKPAFRENGTVTAGNSSGLNDGSAALLLASAEAAKRYTLKPKAKITFSAVVGLEPKIMGMGPLYATEKILKKSKMKLSDFDVIEINEAFASQSLACIRELGLEDEDERVNPNGGAIALGHPLGMSGARLITTAIYELEEQDKNTALCTMCIGVGQGIAVVIERVSR